VADLADVLKQSVLRG